MTDIAAELTALMLQGEIVIDRWLVGDTRPSAITWHREVNGGYLPYQSTASWEGLIIAINRALHDPKRISTATVTLSAQAQQLLTGLTTL